MFTSTTPRRRWTALAGAAASAVLLLGTAACSGSDEDKGTTAEVKSYDKSVAGVVEAATAFLATLDADQTAEAQLDFTQETAVSWSNLPCGSSCRPGVRFGDLNESQLAAAKSVLLTAFGTGEGSGYDQMMQILKADTYLNSVQASGTGGGPGAGGVSGAPGGGQAPGGASGAPGGGQAPGGALPSGGPDGGGFPGGGASGAPDGGGFPGGGASGGPGGGGQAPGGAGASGGPGGGGNGGAGGYSGDTYFIAFLGTPSTTGTWQLNFGGHHLATHLTYKAGQVTGASPFFIGVEPTTWTEDGTTYAPLEGMHSAMLAMTSGLSADEQAAAKLSESFSDVLVGPQEDGQFPATKEGLQVSKLTDDQKKLVLAAIKPWVANADDATATSLMSTYESELDDTYIGWSGTTSLTNHADYVRIDGPSVWIEFVCQNGVVLSNQIHYHTVYRDHTRDYGGEFTFAAK
ncbi:DUF3500 domain-containing protein [Actinoplanes sp. NPDC051851]|uniref:DUF3500 domain-containing protein n=1 Tax=Actinoplanes sp. NPDC051851 TaxID=3154753 RepID=UPI0034378D1E